MGSSARQQSLHQKVYQILSPVIITCGGPFFTARWKAGKIKPRSPKNVKGQNMSESLRMWLEIIFNISYLVVVWWLVIVMWRRRGELPSNRRRLADWVTASFALLALGDTGHVGFRVW